MGNNKFKLSNMIPNTWFYKLKYLAKPPKSPPLATTTTTSTTAKLKKNRLAPPPPPSSRPATTTITTVPETPPPPPPHSEPRKSYHFTRDLPLRPPEDPPLSPPRKSKSKSKSNPKKPSRKITAGAGDRFNSPETGSAVPPNVKNFDIFIHVDKSESEFKSNLYPIKGVDFQLPRIITKPNRSEGKPAGPVQSRRLSVGSPNVGVRLKINSPKIMGIKQGQNGNFTYRKSVKKKRSISESLAVVKSSDDPQRDFRESMVEMIVQNDLRASKDLEDLLACYLSLNSDEYHDVIIEVFKQIWFDLSKLRYKKLVS